MRIAIAVLIITFAASATAMDSAAKYAVWGVGGKACFTFTKDKKSGNGQKYLDYVMGYLTAYNRLTPETYGIAGKMDIDAVDAWLDHYCSKKPMNSFDQAMIDFIHAHTKTRYRVAPFSGN